MRTQGHVQDVKNLFINGKNIKNIFKGITLHLLARIIAWSPAPAEIRLI
jgi:hypothetical protein